MKPVVLVALLLSTIALAGCTSDPAGTDGTGDGMDGETAEEMGIELPEWQVGDWWTYSSSYGNEFTLVVSEDGGTTWVMDTDQTDLAFAHSLLEISFLGDIRKSDLAGSQGSTDVTWLDFPLQHNKEWTTTWDGLDFDMVAHVDVDSGIAHIQASIDGTIVNQATYDDSVGWFTAMIFGDPETGDEVGRIELTESGSGFSGELVRVDPEVVAEASNQGVMNQGLRLWGELDADDADAYLVYTVACETGAFEFGVGTVQGAAAGNTGGVAPFETQGRSINVQCNGGIEDAFAGVVGEAPGNGDSWGDYIVSESPDLQLDYTLYLRHFERITL